MKIPRIIRHNPLEWFMILIGLVCLVASLFFDKDKTELASLMLIGYVSFSIYVKHGLQKGLAALDIEYSPTKFETGIRIFIALGGLVAIVFIIKDLLTN